MEQEKEPFRKELEYIQESTPYVTEIFKGLEMGEPAEKLLLKAVECISKMTGDTLLYNETLNNLKVVYGESLFKEGALQIKIEELQDRLTHLRAAMDNESIEVGDKDRIERSIQKNEQRIAELEELMHKQ